MEPRTRRIEWAIAALLIAGKLWLVRGQGLLAIGDSPGDDRLYLELAQEIAAGHWLGPYRYLTLIKNPFYPIWVAAVFHTHLPLLLAEQLLYVAAVVTFTAAVNPVLPSRRWAWALFVVLLFNPLSFADQAMTRAAREGIYPSLTLLVVAGFLGTAVRLRIRPYRWAALGGAALAALWLCREEGSWIVPVVVLACAAGSDRPMPWQRALVSLALSGSIAAAAVGAVVFLNWRKYGVAVLSEPSQGAFPRAYGALARVIHERWRQYVPVPRETRQRIYAVSPSFAELAPQIEGADLAAWVAPGCQYAGVCDDIAGGWFLWDIRDAAARAGHFTTARESAAFWSSVANEVNAACDSGRLRCIAPRASLVPSWRSEYVPPLLESFATAIGSMVRLQDVTAKPTASVGEPRELELFHKLTHERLAGVDVPSALRLKLDRIRISILEEIVRAFRAVLGAAAASALVAWVLAGVRLLNARGDARLWWAATTVLVGVLSRLAVLTIVDVMAFRSLNVLYLAPAHALLLAFIVLALASAWSSWTAPAAAAPL
jgi:hypothetical protein